MATESENTDNSPQDSESEASLQGPHNRFVLGYYGTPRGARGLLDAQYQIH